MLGFSMIRLLNSFVNPKDYPEPCTVQVVVYRVIDATRVEGL
jgi:hypothetical protein